jgi:hypothetical protein
MRNPLSQYFVAPGSRSNGHPARMLNHSVVRLYKKVTLSGFAFIIDTCDAVRIVTFVSKKPNLTALKPLNMATPTIITTILIISYKGLMFWKK